MTVVATFSIERWLFDFLSEFENLLSLKVFILYMSKVNFTNNFRRLNLKIILRLFVSVQKSIS